MSGSANLSGEDVGPSRFDVDFTPPALGETRVFLPIAGKGTIELAGGHATLRGYGLRSYRGCVFGLAFIGALLAAGCGAGIVATALDIPVSQDVEYGVRTGAGLAMGGLFFTVARMVTPGAADESEEVEFEIRRADVESVEHGPRRAAGRGRSGKVRVYLSGVPNPEYDDEYVLHVNPPGDEHELPDELVSWLEGGEPT